MDLQITENRIGTDGFWSGAGDLPASWGNVWDGIYLQLLSGYPASSEDPVTIEITDNAIGCRNEGAYPAPYGIELLGTDGVTMERNDIWGAKLDGIQLKEANDVTISDNLIFENDYCGVCTVTDSSGSVSDILVTNNRFFLNQQGTDYEFVSDVTLAHSDEKAVEISRNEHTCLQETYTRSPIDIRDMQINYDIIPPIYLGVSAASVGVEDDHADIPFKVDYGADPYDANIFVGESFRYEIYAIREYSYQGEMVKSYRYVGMLEDEYFGTDVDSDEDDDPYETYVATVDFIAIDPDYDRIAITATCTSGTPIHCTSEFSPELAYLAPAVTNVVIVKSGESHDFDEHLGEENQLECVESVSAGAGDLDRGDGFTQVRLVFSQDVQLPTGTDWEDVLEIEKVTNTPTATMYYPSSGSFDAGTNTAAFTFGATILSGRFILRLDDVVENGLDVALDGDWENPASTSDPNGDSFPSGDGTPGGDFEFKFGMVSAADFNCDGLVNDLDASILASHWQGNVGPWGPGDATGDGWLTTWTPRCWPPIGRST